MTATADLLLTNAAVHTPAAGSATDGRSADQSPEPAEAVAIRDGMVVRVGAAHEVSFLGGVDTTALDLDGRVVVPGFIDAHTHLEVVGRREVDADLSTADSPDECIDALAAVTDVHEEWILGFGYDESTWTAARYLTRDDLDAVSESRPVAAFREDMHVVSLNSVAFDRLDADLADGDVHTEDGNPTGVVVEDAADVVWTAIEPDRAGMRHLLTAAQARAHELGITGVHDMVRRRAAPRAYRDLDVNGDLTLRVRLNYWASFLDAVLETGLRTNHGSDRVRTGAIKTFTDGSLGGRTAKLSEPYVDAGDDSATATGKWVIAPDDLAVIVDRADDADLQVAVHAIGDEAIATTLDAFEGTSADARHRIEHAEVLTDELVERLGDSGVVVSAQPNFLKWAREDGLYESRLGPERTRETNRFRELLDAGAMLAFGSDCMPMDPLFGIQQAVTAPAAAQRLTVTEALRAYTHGAASAGFDEDRLGTIERGKRADLTVLEESPWDIDPESIADIDVEMTVVDGEIVHDSR
jgi:predicted amidohydrolase YtcJ